MAIPFTTYISIKDNYCLSYFGEDEDTLKNVIQAREVIEKELKGLKVFVACKDSMKKTVFGKRNIIFESKLNDFKGRFAGSCDLEGKSDLELLLLESKIKIF
jgi:hypothetical protein